MAVPNVKFAPDWHPGYRDDWGREQDRKKAFNNTVNSFAPTRLSRPFLVK